MSPPPSIDTASLVVTVCTSPLPPAWTSPPPPPPAWTFTLLGVDCVPVTVDVDGVDGVDGVPVTVDVDCVTMVTVGVDVARAVIALLASVLLHVPSPPVLRPPE